MVGACPFIVGPRVKGEVVRDLIVKEIEFEFSPDSSIKNVSLGVIGDIVCLEVQKILFGIQAKINVSKEAPMLFEVLVFGEFSFTSFSPFHTDIDAFYRDLAFDSGLLRKNNREWYQSDNQPNDHKSRFHYFTPSISRKLSLWNPGHCSHGCSYGSLNMS